jgi:hypothetical protein
MHCAISEGDAMKALLNLAIHYTVIYMDHL